MSVVQVSCSAHITRSKKQIRPEDGKLDFAETWVLDENLEKYLNIYKLEQIGLSYETKISSHNIPH